MIFTVAILGQNDCKMLHNILHTLRQFFPQLTSQVIPVISQRPDETQRNAFGGYLCMVCNKREMPFSVMEYQVQGKGSTASE